MSDQTNDANKEHDMKGHCDSIHFFINKQQYETLDHTLTGLQIKQKANIPPPDELFLETDCGDEVVPNDATLLVRKNDRFHSMPSPQYGALTEAGVDQVEDVLALYPGSVQDQPDGWHHLVIDRFPLPPAYLPQAVELLVKLPPLYPMAAPDMFWLRPSIRLAGGGPPQATSMETINGHEWQRFSWHLPAGFWQPSQSTLRDYMRAVMARLQRAN